MIITITCLNRMTISVIKTAINMDPVKMAKTVYEREIGVAVVAA